jgi:hypothetical protein
MKNRLKDYKDRVAQLDVIHVVSLVEDDGVALVREPTEGSWDWNKPMWKEKKSDFVEMEIRRHYSLDDYAYERQVSALGGEICEFYIGTELTGRTLANGSFWYWDGPKPVVLGTDMVKIKPPTNDEPPTVDYLQIKKSSVSENSSSAVSKKHPSDLHKFFVFNNKTGETQWHKFPCEESRQYLSDEGLISATQEYLLHLPSPFTNIADEDAAE